MAYSMYELLGLFLFYSFLGWVIETIVGALKQKRFVNRGLINGPFCVIYGIGAVIITVFGQELHGIWLILGTLIITTVIEWTAGHLIERMYHERWWDYSDIKFNLDGYVCLRMSVIWSGLAIIMMRIFNPLMRRFYNWAPQMPIKVIIGIIITLLLVDILATMMIMTGRSKRIEQWQSVDNWLSGISSRLGKAIYGSVDRRIKKAYPKATATEKTKVDKTVFASGCGFDKVVWLFVIGSFLGDIVETLFCRYKAGVWMSRSSLVWGPFSIVWGGAIAAATVLLYKYRKRSNTFLFIIGTFIGGAYEYMCSVGTELFFGKVFWDYSHMPFNLGGRINLLYCFFWGFAAVVWFKIVYPKVSEWIEKIPIKVGKILTWVMVVFMCLNMLVSALALVRSEQRNAGVPAASSWQQIMDERFDDERLQRIYPNAINVE